jgi:hypothetical protein
MSFTPTQKVIERIREIQEVKEFISNKEIKEQCEELMDNLIYEWHNNTKW